MLTARDSVQDRVRGLEGGADDYLVKPFAFEELLALYALCYGASGPEAGTPGGERLQFAYLELCRQARQVFAAGVEVALTAREFDLLAFFMTHARHVLTREKIFSEVWGYDHDRQFKCDRRSLSLLAVAARQAGS